MTQNQRPAAIATGDPFAGDDPSLAKAETEDLYQETLRALEELRIAQVRISRMRDRQRWQA